MSFFHTKKTFTVLMVEILSAPLHRLQRRNRHDRRIGLAVGNSYPHEGADAMMYQSTHQFEHHTVEQKMPTPQSQTNLPFPAQEFNYPASKR